MSALSKMWLWLVMFCLLACFLLSVLGGWSWGWSFSLLGLVLSEFDVDVFIEKVRVVCVCMLVFCGSTALFYCHHYFGVGKDAVLLFPLMVWFLGVMVVLVISGRLLFSLLM